MYTFVTLTQTEVQELISQIKAEQVVEVMNAHDAAEIMDMCAKEKVFVQITDVDECLLMNLA